MVILVDVIVVKSICRIIRIKCRDGSDAVIIVTQPEISGPMALRIFYAVVVIPVICELIRGAFCGIQYFDKTVSKFFIHQIEIAPGILDQPCAVLRRGCAGFR